MATVIVIDGVAAAIEVATGTPVPNRALHLAEAAAGALEADLVAIVIAMDAGDPVVWDVRPVPEFRQAVPLAKLTVPQAISQAVERRLVAAMAASHPADRQDWSKITLQGQAHGQGTRRDLVISA
jgi:hypothetical protein